MRADVLDGTWSPPVSDGSGRDRAHAANARSLCSRPRATSCAAPNWSNAQTGAPFTFEIMVDRTRRGAAGAAVRAKLKRAGITVRVRVVDAVQYEGRRIAYDFDMIENRWDQSLSPGNEQAFYWGSAAAGQHGTRNYMGVKSPAVDAMIAALLKAQEPRGFRRRSARARSRADVRLLRDSVVSSSGAVGGALGNHRAAYNHLALWLSSGDVVAEAKKPMTSPLRIMAS